MLLMKTLFVSCTKFQAATIGFMNSVGSIPCLGLKFASRQFIFSRLSPVFNSRCYSSSVSSCPSSDTHVSSESDESCESRLDVYIAEYSKIATDPKLHRQRVRKAPEQVDDSKLLNVAIIGKTNAGKSVLTNALVGLPVSAASKRCHTTRRNTCGVSIVGKNQLVFVDTPGFLTNNVKQKEVEDNLATDQENSLKEAELILVLHDISNEFTRNRLDARIQYLLYRYRHLPSVLVLNKMDLLKNKSLALDIITKLTKNIVDGSQLTQMTSSILNDTSENERPERKNAKKLQEIVNNYKNRRKIENLRAENGNFHEKSENLHAENENLRAENVKNCQNDDQNLNTDKFLKEIWSEIEWSNLEKLKEKPVHLIPRSQLKKIFLRENGWPKFEAVFSISALTGSGIDNLKEFLISRAKLNAWRYNSKVVSPLSNVQLVKENVRGKMMEYVDHHIPYTLRFKVESWEVNEHDTLGILMTIICEHEKHVPIVIGYQSRRITQISKECSQDLSNLFGVDVYIKFNVVAKPRKK